MSRPKGSKNKKHRRGRGRPKGSKNKKVHSIKFRKRKRGRPKKVYEAAKKIEYPEVKPVKFLGYCKCGFMITKKELVSKFIYLCPLCEKRNRISKLKDEKKSEIEKPKTKKEYLENIIHVQYVAADHDDHIDPNHLKVQE